MLHRSLIACALAFAAFSSPAFAQTFDGPYLGVEVGYERLSDDLDGGVYGLFAGWDVPVSANWVIGIEGRLAAPDTSFRLTRETGAGTAVSSVDVNSQYGIGARIGYLVGKNTLLYGHAGYERFDVDSTIVTTPTPPCVQCNPTLADFSFDEDMVTLGAGIEHAVTDRVRTRIVYTYGDGDAFERNRVSLGVAYQF
ncbi:porin family protein [Novosphingobium mangrovi (ex Huang et al. 2023)]|uniref:Porin family protein n=1 Tax=Novosphingobium mangrovi (ex Huang et al. 2023) TaxID=2976432 RepID=A0ABT2I5M5_9SPHN|nr:porin family protein [Novosphingobium mangrovi (ex Huang et al. 2023)]MCT2399852.1 porin family protein [Novosphingobium mangrovi (ex Huang et al. 2023)]